MEKLPRVQTTSLDQFLTSEQLEHCCAIWVECAGNDILFVGRVEVEVMLPNMAEINRKIGQENNARYLAYATYYVFSQVMTRKGLEQG